MRRGTPRRSEQNQSFDEEIGKIPEQLPQATLKKIQEGLCYAALKLIQKGSNPIFETDKEAHEWVLMNVGRKE